MCSIIKVAEQLGNFFSFDCDKLNFKNTQFRKGLGVTVASTQEARQAVVTSMTFMVTLTTAISTEW